MSTISQPNNQGQWQQVMAGILQAIAKREKEVAENNRLEAAKYPDPIKFYAERAFREKVMGTVILDEPNVRARFEWRTVNGLLIQVQDTRELGGGSHSGGVKEAWAQYNAKAMAVAA